MRTREEAARDLFDAGWTLDEVVEVFACEQLCSCGDNSTVILDMSETNRWDHISGPTYFPSPFLNPPRIVTCGN
jgi:hypothetical protein